VDLLPGRIERRAKSEVIHFGGAEFFAGGTPAERDGAANGGIWGKGANQLLRDPFDRELRHQHFGVFFAEIAAGRPNTRPRLLIVS